MSDVLTAWIEGVGLRGPGLPGWSASVDVLAGRRAYVSTPTVLSAPAALPPAERRRVGRGVKIALDVAFEAATQAARDPATLATVFTSSSGDGDNCDAICRELAGDRMISPTRFHNSVHNAPSGYWGIASRSMHTSTSLCAYDHSFVAGLDDALTLLAAGVETVLLVAYDAPYPEPLFTARPTPDSFGVALLLTREPGPDALAKIVFDDRPRSSSTTTMIDPGLERCRAEIPAARALPLLAALAAADDRDLVFAQVNGGHVALRVQALSHPSQCPRQAACA